MCSHRIYAHAFTCDLNFIKFESFKSRVNFIRFVSFCFSFFCWMTNIITFSDTWTRSPFLQCKINSFALCSIWINSLFPDPTPIYHLPLNTFLFIIFFVSSFSSFLLRSSKRLSNFTIQKTEPALSVILCFSWWSCFLISLFFFFFHFRVISPLTS